MRPRASAECSWLLPPSRRHSFLLLTRTRSLPIRSNAWPRRWPARLATSAAVAVAVATCARPRDAVAPIPAAPVGREPEIRIGIAVAVPRATIGGQAETAAVVSGETAFRLFPGQDLTVQA